MGALKGVWAECMASVYHGYRIAVLHGAAGGWAKAVSAERWRDHKLQSGRERDSSSHVAVHSWGCGLGPPACIVIIELLGSGSCCAGVVFYCGQPSCARECYALSLSHDYVTTAT